jgi:hypothetical protein
MQPLNQNSLGFYFDIIEDWLEEAKQMRAERDQRYGNIFTEYGSDLRWIGELGEITFNYWLKQQGITQYEWILENPAGKSDFIINTLQVDVKTVKRQGPPKPGYTAQITAKHINTPADELFFLSYEFPIKRLWFLGGIKKIEFLRFARYYGENERVHASYVIRKGHEIYNIETSRLLPPYSWLEKIK